MKNRHIFNGTLILAFCISLCFNTSTAQVRQIFKITDIGTGQPIQGVQLTIDGQNITSDAKGTAVFRFPGKNYGDYTNLYFKINKPGYTYLNKGWKGQSWATDILSRDTMHIYMVETARYEKERDRLFDSLFHFHYRNAYLPFCEQGLDAVKDDPDDANEWFSVFVQANLYNDIKTQLFDIADHINPLQMSYIDSDIRRESERALLNGDYQTCLSLARAQIAENDVSEQNLQKILYYLDLRLAVKDTTPAKEYYELLFNRGFNRNDNFLIDYLNCLHGEDSVKEENIRTYIKDNCKDPYMHFIVSRPIPYSLFLKNPEEGKAESLTRIRLLKQHVQDCYFAEIDFRINAAYFHIETGDSLEACRQLDTAYSLLFRPNGLDFQTELDSNLWFIKKITDLMLLPAEKDSAFPITKNLINKHLQLLDETCQKQHTLYNNLLYLYALKNSIEYSDSENINRRILEMDRITCSLLTEFPHLMLPQHMANRYMLLRSGLYFHADKDSLQRLFSAYRSSMLECESLYPYLYDYALNRNFDLKIFCYAQESYSLLDELDAFTAELLEKKAAYFGKDSLVLKGEFYNTEAEQLYHRDYFQQALPLYDKAIRYHERAAQTNGMSHIHILHTWLQKGDAYMQSEQYGEALRCYRQVFGRKLPDSLQTAYSICKGASYHFQGDICTIIDKKKAMTYYNKSDKEYIRAEKAGDTTLYSQWGELHYSEAMFLYNQGEEKKCIEELIRAEELYDRYPLHNVSQKYQTLKRILTDYYRNNKQANKLLFSLTQYFRYCDTVKYNSVELCKEYVSTAIQLGNMWSNYSVASAAVRYFKAAKEGMDVLMDYGGEKDLRYLQTLYSLGTNYRGIDSNALSLDMLRQCLELNRGLIAEEDPTQCTYNELNIQNQMVRTYLSIPDSERTSSWGKEALALQQDIVSRLSTMDTNPALKRNLAYHHKQLGRIYLNLDRETAAIRQFDSCVAIILPMYQQGERENTENDLANAYRTLAYTYYIMEDREADSVKANLNRCLAICEHAVSHETILEDYYIAASMMLEMLSDPLAPQDEAALRKFRNLKASLGKELEKQDGKTPKVRLNKSFYRKTVRSAKKEK